MNHWLEHFSGVFSIPVLLMHGSDDKITSAAGSRLFNGNVAGDVTYQEWQGLWHEMHNEPQKEDFFKFTNSWINKYI
jgi:alpha-beta hydrolase superfamily lysophospholipase